MTSAVLTMRPSARAALISATLVGCVADRAASDRANGGPGDRADHPVTLAADPVADHAAQYAAKHRAADLVTAAVAASAFTQPIRPGLFPAGRIGARLARQHRGMAGGMGHRRSAVPFGAIVGHWAVIDVAIGIDHAGRWGWQRGLGPGRCGKRQRGDAKQGETNRHGNPLEKPGDSGVNLEFSIRSGL